MFKAKYNLTCVCAFSGGSDSCFLLMKLCANKTAYQNVFVFILHPEILVENKQKNLYKDIQILSEYFGLYFIIKKYSKKSNECSLVNFRNFKYKIMFEIATFLKIKKIIFGTNRNDVIEGFLFKIKRKVNIISMFTPLNTFAINLGSYLDIERPLLKTTKNIVQRHSIVLWTDKTNQDISSYRPYIRFAFGNKINSLYSGFLTLRNLIYSSWKLFDVFYCPFTYCASVNIDDVLQELEISRKIIVLVNLIKIGFKMSHDLAVLRCLFDRLKHKNNIAIDVSGIHCFVDIESKKIVAYYDKPFVYYNSKRIIIVINNLHILFIYLHDLSIFNVKLDIKKQRAYNRLINRGYQKCFLTITINNVFKFDISSKVRDANVYLDNHFISIYHFCIKIIKNNY